MTQPGRATSVGGAESKFGFEVVGVGDGASFSFVPIYYPERFNVEKPRDIQGEADSCKGENLTLNKIENFRIHATGFLGYNNSLSDYQSLCNHQESTVEVINPILPNGGLECLVEKPEFGEIRGYDPKLEDWLVDYTVDFISTGKDEDTGSSGKSGIVDEGSLGSSNGIAPAEPSLEESIADYEG